MRRKGGRKGREKGCEKGRGDVEERKGREREVKGTRKGDHRGNTDTGGNTVVTQGNTQGGNTGAQQRDETWGKPMEKR